MFNLKHVLWLTRGEEIIIMRKNCRKTKNFHQVSDTATCGKQRAASSRQLTVCQFAASAKPAARRKGHWQTAAHGCSTFRETSAAEETKTEAHGCFFFFLFFFTFQFPSIIDHKPPHSLIVSHFAPIWQRCMCVWALGQFFFSAELWNVTSSSLLRGRRHVMPRNTSLPVWVTVDGMFC